MSISSFKNNMFKTYAKDGGKLLIHAGAAGWLFSSLAQVTVIATDSKISKKDKKFLVPQEICDGATNVVLYYTVSKIIKESGDYLINKGHLLTDDVVKAITKLKPETTSIKEAAKGLTEKWVYVDEILNKKHLKTPLKAVLENYKLTEAFQKLSPAQKTAFEKEIKAAAEHLSNFKNGIGVITSIAASILASNILTPIVRNKMAGVYQQKFIMKEDSKNKPAAVTVTPKGLAAPDAAANVQPVFTPQAFRTFTMGGNLKI